MKRDRRGQAPGRDRPADRINRRACPLDRQHIHRRPADSEAEQRVLARGGRSRQAFSDRTAARMGPTISLEGVLWDTLAEIAATRGVSINRLITEIDRDRSGSPSSAIHV